MNSSARHQIISQRPTINHNPFIQGFKNHQNYSTNDNQETSFMSADCVYTPEGNQKRVINQS